MQTEDVNIIMLITYTGLKGLPHTDVVSMEAEQAKASFLEITTISNESDQPHSSLKSDAL